MRSDVADVPGQAFAKNRRLTRSPQFEAVFSEAQRSADRHFVVLARRRPAGSQTRLGLAISRKCARRAVYRNRIKRIVRESFRCRDWPRCCHLDLVVLCRPAATAADNRTLFRAIGKHWRELETRLCADSQPC